MKIKSHLKKFIVIGTILLIVIPILPAGFSNNTNIEEKQISKMTISNHYENSIVVIIGKCNIVQGPLIWIFGLYIPFMKRTFTVKASGGEGEQLNVMVRGDQFVTHLDNENIEVQFSGAKGILFWGQKSILTNSSRVFVRCKADDVWISIFS